VGIGAKSLTRSGDTTVVTEIQVATDGTVKSMNQIVRVISDIKEIASSIQ